MIILNKKRILFVIFAITISIFSSINKNILPTSSIPVSSHIVVLDAGHGFPDGGATSNDGTEEANINLDIVQKIQKLLEASGCCVILTRSDENGIYDFDAKSKKKSDLINRTKIANESNGEIFISIHLNKINISNCSGWQTFYQPTSKNSKELANYIQSNLNTTIENNKSREILPLTDKYLMDNVKIPTVTVECGFLSNAIDLSNLKTPSYQEKLAWGIYQGIIDYFSSTMI